TRPGTARLSWLRKRPIELGSLNRLMTDLRERGIVTKVRLLKTGRMVGGIPFTRGPLALFLRNRFYIGEVVFKGEVLPGEQPAILERELFDAVQTKLNEQRNNQSVTRDDSRSLRSRKARGTFLARSVHPATQSAGLFAASGHWRTSSALMRRLLWV